MASVTIRMSPEVSDKLDALARETNRSAEQLAEEALAAFVERSAWQVGEIKAGLAEAQAGAPGIAHEDIERWVESWGTENELPPPQPR